MDIFDREHEAAIITGKQRLLKRFQYCVGRAGGCSFRTTTLELHPSDSYVVATMRVILHLASISFKGHVQ